MFKSLSCSNGLCDLNSIRILCNSMNQVINDCLTIVLIYWEDWCLLQQPRTLKHAVITSMMPILGGWRVMRPTSSHLATLTVIYTGPGHSYKSSITVHTSTGHVAKFVSKYWDFLKMKLKLKHRDESFNNFPFMHKTISVNYD